MNQKGAVSSIFGIVVVLVIAAGIGGYIYLQSQTSDYDETIPLSYTHEDKGTTRTTKPTIPPPQGMACTQEAKQCPDGSYVGRTGPNCEFAACPEVTKTKWDTREECEQTTQRVCSSVMCDTNCPTDFENGWVAR